MKTIHGYPFRVLFLCAVLLLNAGCDQASKFIARSQLKGQGTVQVVSSFVVLAYAENRGAFLGLGSHIPKALRVILLGAVPLLVLVVLFIYLLRAKDMRLLTLAGFGCVLGGGIGNIAERLVRGYVVDFLNFGIGRLRTGILNIADLSVFAGVIIVAFTMKKHEPPDTGNLSTDDGPKPQEFGTDLDNN
ncbi:MAG: signal peptidase II [Spirochaetales bacterium]|nr:MAG: signal peptidase II [Spirochaetales bacterium]